MVFCIPNGSRGLTVEARKVRVKVLLRSIVSEEFHRHGRETTSDNNLTRDAIGDLGTLDSRSAFICLVVDGHCDPKTSALTSTDVQRGQWVLETQTRRQVGASGYICELDVCGEALIVEPLKEGFCQHHASARDDVEGAEIRDVPRTDAVLTELMQKPR